MKIAIGTDHRGFVHKEYIKTREDILLVNWLDVGTFDEQRTDYPIYARKVCEAIMSGSAQYGVLLCSTGVGMAIAANRYKNIYAALAWNSEIAQSSKMDDNANVLVLPSDYVSPQEAVAMIHVWLEAEFRGGRYADRIKMIDKM